MYNNSQQKPLIVAPGAFFDEAWYDEFVRKTGPKVVHVLTHHIYNMGASLTTVLATILIICIQTVLRTYFWFVGNDPKLIYIFVNSTNVSQVSNTFEQLENVIQKNAPWAAVEVLIFPIHLSIVFGKQLWFTFFFLLGFSHLNMKEKRILGYLNNDLNVLGIWISLGWLLCIYESIL